MIDLSTKYLGLQLRNPLIVGSSGLTDSVDSLKNLEENGAAAVVLKSLFEEEIINEMEVNLRKMASESFIYPETLEFYENNTVEESSAEKYLQLIRDAKKALTIPVIASINCVTSREWTSFPKKIQEAGADALELNIFVMPSDFNRNSEENEKVYFEIIAAVKKQVSIPISLKVSYYFSNLGQMLLKLSESGIEGLVLFNRFYSPDFDLDKMEVTSSSILSSPDDFPTALRWIAIMAERTKCNLAASTGIHDGNALIKQILAGADAVQCVSALYQHGADYLQVMLAELETWMHKRGYHNLDEMRGMLSQARSKNPAAYERVQFMKYFRGYRG